MRVLMIGFPNSDAALPVPEPEPLKSSEDGAPLKGL
jgi:hypothetical protein